MGRCFARTYLLALRPRNAFRRRGLAVFTDLAQMLAHGFAGVFSLALFDCCKDLFVVNLAALGASGNFKDAEALFAQQSDDGIDQRKNDRIGGGFGECQMKVVSSFVVGVGVVVSAAHYDD